MMTLSNYDWPAFDGAIACKNGSGVFQTHKDVNGALICSSGMTASLAGTPVSGNIVAITVTDSVEGGNHYSVGYLVPNNTTTLATIATELATNLNNPSYNNGTGPNPLPGWGVSATAVGSQVTISSGTNASTYTNSSNNTNVTISGLTSITAGGGNTFSNTYSADKFNDAVLQLAWPHYFFNTDAPFWVELFAEETAIVAGQAAPLGQTQDDYLGSGNFICSKNFVNAVENTGSPPTGTSFPYSSGCK